MKFAHAARMAIAVAGIGLDRILGRKRPFLVNHLVTVRCNQQCSFCHVSGPGQREHNRVHYPETSELDTAEVLNFYRQLVAEDFRFAVILGGEPLLRADLGELLCAVEGELLTTVFTNGYLLEERAELLKGASSVFVSLDAPDAQHDALRGCTDSFRRAIAGIGGLKRRFPRLNVVLNMTVGRENATRVAEMLQLAESLGVGIAFQPRSFTQEAPGDREALTDAFNRIREAAKRGRRVVGSQAFFDSVARGSQAFSCFSPQFMLGPVFPNGDVIGCTTANVLGNVRKTTVHELVSGAAFVENAARGRACERGCRDWGIYDLSAIYNKELELNDVWRYYRALVGHAGRAVPG